MMVCLIFHTAIIVYRKNWKITIKLYFENFRFFLKKANVHVSTLGLPLVLGPSSPCSFLVTFQWHTPHLLLNERTLSMTHMENDFCIQSISNSKFFGEELFSAIYCITNAVMILIILGFYHC